MASLIVDHRDIRGAFQRLSLPIAVQMLGDQVLGVADTIAIGSLGAVALAGATAANTLFVVLLFAAFGLTTGTSIVAAQYVGAQDVSAFGRTVRAGAVAPLVAGVLALLLALVFSGTAMHALVGNLPSANASAAYLVLRCASILPIAITATLIVALSAAGNRIAGILVLVIVNLVHIPLLLMLALGWWTHRPMGIAGAGLSSLLSETIAAIFIVLYVARKPAYRIFESLEVSLPLAWRCAVLGIPEAVFLLGVMLPDVVVVAMLAPLGPTIVSAFRALNVVSDLTFVLPSPLQSAAQIVIGQRLGARDPEGALWFLRRAQRVAVVVTLAGGIVAAACAWPLAFVFTLNAQVATIAAMPLAVHMITLPLKGWAMVSLAPIRASGDTRFSMTVGLVCAALVIPFAWLGIEKLHVGLYSVPLGWIAAWSVRSLLTHLKLRNGAWLKNAPLAA
ncbi:MAG: MATE family efflux transporter [Candidatus Eremiobacteraeota bacterium]|nr:MATE family efflux transporter [Candidatus Eremiobacteraeota bacterium]